MDVITELAQATGVELRRSGPMKLVACADAEDFINAIQRRDLFILGIEGFRFEGEFIAPDMGAIADFSGPTSGPYVVADCAADAIRFIRKVGTPDMFFEFWLGPP